MKCANCGRGRPKQFASVLVKDSKGIAQKQILGFCNDYCYVEWKGKQDKENKSEVDISK